MTLLAHPISFGQPGSDFVIDLIRAFEAKRVEMISWRKSFDAAKAGMFEPARQNDVAVQPILSNHKRREAHSNLECDPSFLREDNNRATFLRDAQQLVKDGTDSPRFPGEMGRKRVSAAGVRLISIGK